MSARVAGTIGIAATILAALTHGTAPVCEALAALVAVPLLWIAALYPQPKRSRRNARTL